MFAKIVSQQSQHAGWGSYLGTPHTPAWSCLHLIGKAGLGCRLERPFGQELREQRVRIQVQVCIQEGVAFGEVQVQWMAGQRSQFCGVSGCVHRPETTDP